MSTRAVSIAQDLADHDLYAVLGVPSDATDDQIREAYRRRALERHPDLRNGEAEAHAQMALLNRARDVLCDPSARLEYDRQRRLRRAGSAGGRTDGGPQPPASSEPVRGSAVWGEQDSREPPRPAPPAGPDVSRVVRIIATVLVVILTLLALVMVSRRAADAAAAGPTSRPPSSALESSF